MRKYRESTPVVPEASRLSRKYRLLLATLALSLASLLVRDKLGSVWSSITNNTAGITTPWGIVYFSEEPTAWIQDHEQCHYDRLQEIGAAAFYADYALGGACEEELRCGATLSHPACAQYPLSRLPDPSTLEPWWISIQAMAKKFNQTAAEDRTNNNGR